MFNKDVSGSVNPNLQGLQGHMGGPNDFGVDDLVDLDHYLDHYLVQLQNDQRTSSNPAVLGDNINQMNNSSNLSGLAWGSVPMVGGSAVGNNNFNSQLGIGMGQPQLGLNPMSNFYSLPSNAVGAGGNMGNLSNLQNNATIRSTVMPPLPSESSRSVIQPQALPNLSKSSSRQRMKTNSSRGSRKSEAEVSSEELDSSADSASSDDEQRSKKKKELPLDEAERRHLALQEKNRKAQRRFRERQKNKLQELHKQIEDLNTKVSQLQTENSALHSRTSILEKVLDMRNEQIQVMQENKEVTEAELATLNAPGNQLVPLTSDMMKELSSEEIYKIYQTYVKELSVRLVDANRGALNDSQGHLDLERLVKDMSVLIMRLGVAKPLETRKFIVFSRQYLGNTEKEVIDLWKTVMRNIDLSEPQMREVVDLKRMFLQKIEPIMEERKHLNVSIQSNLPHDTFHTKNSISYIKAHEAVSKLRDNLRAEQHIVLEFAIAVFRGVFKPRQMATLLVKCYPAVPDALGIATALASELGEPDTPATQQLAMQLGGYSIAGNNMLLGPPSNYLNIGTMNNNGGNSTSTPGMSNLNLGSAQGGPVANGASNSGSVRSGVSGATNNPGTNPLAGNNGLGGGVAFSTNNAADLSQIHQQQATVAALSAALVSGTSAGSTGLGGESGVNRGGTGGMISGVEALAALTGNNMGGGPP
uniref:BZIP domain-containing protein n=1 Tax=Polytomella parva TaxID=51329 RepID=A0A7S0VB73_9CHLO|nr:predicted protein [Polytomella parva]|mmetsp:Transcript_29450/g.54045  ORF Transcript_29450/g.54045 Transcript_29450/m.54045 type:complete len:700 (+) Transcript_29450:248-2347(+)|eukprot:CAMPEP_0175043162 /NCGR_PEP_ID=MMETSP0052_2-20121109/3008_1 /TAXON_ID=51329 ORGANISM="Polytomella parva, Strain SAG 63-3" /NCGR_SAMPLE_ID=MMETSP0052_2 /ASSEMBLY_ACC=CAM_ASM_000194 /LENGTH=699 /DNA_ID=CAMNT_0016306139 /DNA_START=207 /DNA_END=2306 /DNA_ORIENTATION=-